MTETAKGKLTAAVLRVSDKGNHLNVAINSVFFSSLAAENQAKYLNRFRTRNVCYWKIDFPVELSMDLSDEEIREIRVEMIRWVPGAESARAENPEVKMRKKQMIEFSEDAGFDLFAEAMGKR